MIEIKSIFSPAHLHEELRYTRKLTRMRTRAKRATFIAIPFPFFAPHLFLLEWQMEMEKRSSWCVFQKFFLHIFTIFRLQKN